MTQIKDTLSACHTCRILQLSAAKIYVFWALLGVMFFFFACTTTPIEQADPVPYRGNLPRSILVMPPVNLSPDVEAPLTFLATSTYPLAESGYYVIPVALSDLTFKQNGVTIAEEAHAIDPARLRGIFGADAALYITITRFGAVYYILNSVVEAAATARLIDLRDGQEIWSGRVSVSEGSNQSSGNLINALLGAAIEQIANTLSDRSYNVGRRANYQLLFSGRKDGIPYGPRSPNYGNN